MIKAILIVIIIILITSPGWCESGPILENRQLKISDQFSLKYTIIFPAGYQEKNKRKSMPLILALHFGFDPNKPFPDYYGQGILTTLVYPALNPLGAIMIAPDSHGKRWNDPFIQRAVLKLLNFVQRHYRIDPQKRIITGFSMGGIGAWNYAAGFPQYFDLAIPVAGQPGIDDIRKFKKTPVYAINSETDHLFPRRKIKAYIEILRSKNIEIEFPVIPKIRHFDTPGFVGPLKNSIPWILKHFESPENQ